MKKSLMLAALAVLGHEDIHHMNGLKNLLSLFINGVASIYFFQSGMVLVRDTVIMASGAILGGLIIGFAESFGAYYISTDYKDIIAFVLLVVILSLRPQGLFAKRSR